MQPTQSLKGKKTSLSLNSKLLAEYLQYAYKPVVTFGKSRWKKHFRNKVML